MKQRSAFIPAVLFAAGVTVFIAQPAPKGFLDESSGLSRRDGTLSSEGLEIKESVKYELMRLRDPQTGRIPRNIRQLELEYAATLPGYSTLLRSGALSEALALNWQSRGPWNVGGRTRAFAIDASNPSKLLAGSTSGGMWTSVNSGNSWTQTWGIAHQSISCLAQDTRIGKTNTWYAGTGEGYGQSASGGSAYYLGNGIYKSTDGGATWNVLSSTSSGTPQTFENVWDIVWNVVTNPADTVNDAVYAASYGAIWRSINGGTSWTVVKGSASSSPFSYFTDVAVSKTGVLYATLSSDGAQKGIYRSTNGTTWVNITPANFPSTYGRVRIGISPKDENQVYFWAGTTAGPNSMCDTNFLGDIECNSLFKYKYLTGDGSGSGGAWWDLSQNLPTFANGFTGPHDKQHVQGGYDMHVNPHPSDTNVVFLGGTNLYRSNTGFRTADSTFFVGGYKRGGVIPHTVNTYAVHHPDQHAVAFDTTGANIIMYSANDGGIYKTTNCMADTVVWTSLNKGYLTSMFYTVTIDKSATNDSTLIGGTQDNNSWFVNSMNPQATWKSIYFGDGSYCAITNNKNDYYFSIQNGKIRKMSLNTQGDTLAQGRIDPKGGTGYLFINPFVIDPNNSNRMYLAGGKNLWRNDSLNILTVPSQIDSAITTGWTKFPDTVPTTGAKISALAVSKAPVPNIVYYGTTNRRVYRINNAHTGTPLAVDITGTAFPNNSYVSCVSVNPKNHKQVMVAFSNYNVYSIFYTANADSTVPTWTKVAGNLEQNSNSTGSGNGPSVRWVSIMPVSDGVVYLAATSTGLYVTDTLKGTSTVWTQQGASTIGNSICNMIDFRETDGLVAVATHSRGIFTTNITSKNDVVGVNDIVNASAVELTNFPNPFSGTTTIQFSLSKRSNVKLSIYDLNGRLIQLLADREFSAGRHSLNFPGERISAGIYYCVLKSEEATETRKLLLIK